MNLLTLGIIAFLLLCILRGYRRGFFKSAAGMIGIVLAVVLSSLLYPTVNYVLYHNTSMDETIEQAIIDKFELPQDMKTATRNEEIELIDRLELPENIKDWLIENCNAEDFVETGVSNVCDYVAVSLTGMVMRGISYVITFLLTGLIIQLVLHVLNVASYIPIVKSINHAGGILFGAGQAVLLTWVFMCAVTLFSAYEWAFALMKMIDESPVLAWFYEKNIFLKLVVDILGRI